jgi:GNAT superfamily N-acetyltransferase
VSAVRELLPPDTGRGWRAMLALRPQIGDAGAFARHVDEIQRPEGYRLLGSFEDGAPEASAVAGFRLVHHLAWGRALYVDDLSTLEAARGRGHAGALLDHVIAEAKRLGCGELHLDSGVGAPRWNAHRLYMNHGLTIVSHHFSRPV